MKRLLIVTHHAPDLDACCSVWLLKRFDSQHYGSAKIAFVNPGETITLEEAESHGSQLHEATHVDTGLGEFDHHQKERGRLQISASSLVYNDHLSKLHPELKNDQALKALVDLTTEIDHFGEIFWPDADSPRYSLMIHELIRGLEFTDPHDDDSQLHFGLSCLDAAYATLKQHLRAKEIIAEKGIDFNIAEGKCLGVETSNDDTIKQGQKMGYILVVRKDPKKGNVRIKSRPDSKLDLKDAHEKIKQLDSTGSWFYHPSGKMLINGSRKHRNQVASPLSLDQVIKVIKEVYA